MKYDLTQMISEKLNKDGVSPLGTDEWAMIRDINSSMFPELDGLRTLEASTSVEEKKENGSLIHMELGTSEKIPVELFITRTPEYTECLFDCKEHEFLVSYKHDKKTGKIDIERLEFVKGNDNICMYGSKYIEGHYYNIYTNTAGTGKVYGKYIKDVIPDYYCKVGEFNFTDVLNNIIGCSKITIAEDYREHTLPTLGIDEVVLDKRYQANTRARAYRFTCEHLDNLFHEMCMFEGHTR